MFSEKEREKKVCGIQTMQKFIDRKKTERNTQNVNPGGMNDLFLS